MEASADTVALWWHYEEIAMHFNNLLMQYRLQLMGGTGAIGAIASYYIGGHIDKAERRHIIRAYISTGLFFLVAAAAALDLLYYNELLLGAVDALMKFEAEHPEIYMSTLIARRFVGSGMSAIYIVYSAILIPLFALIIWSWCVSYRERQTQA